ncbi:hypothetical protein SAMN05428970_1161 [Agromyces sp. CF514]|uniref:ATP-binding protein n=1 Tax=Agromyces sp. CF514 TaxID=1881031 RepID=UPI0008E14138|nr:ATP-binding protein [Agromyces sp. CF514]SFR71318.1 hypothetical protein SAMN05428970_1161 [Agromyces sp. CF514]
MPREAVAVPLIDIASTVLSGLVPAPILKIAEVVAKAAVDGHKPPVARTAIAGARRELRRWIAVEGIPNDALDTGAQLAIDALAEWGPLTAERVVRFRSDPAAIAADILTLAERAQPSEGERAVCRQIVERVIAAVLADADARAELGFDLQVGTAVAVETLGAKIDLLLDGDAPSGLELDRLRTRSRAGLDRMANAQFGRHELVGWDASEEPARTLDTWRWSEQVDRALRSIIAGSNGVFDVEPLRRILAQATMPFESLRARLIDARLPDLLSRAAAARRADADAIDPDVLTSLHWLVEQCAAPEYRIVLPVVGGWGTGKTTVSRRTADELFTRGRFVIVVAPVARAGFEDELARAASAVLDRPITSAAQLATELGELDRHAVVVVDDAHEWGVEAGFAAALQHAISASTVGDRVRWVVSTSVEHFDTVHDRRNPRFWAEYGTEGRPDTWLDLDRTNVAQQLGRDILVTAAPVGDRPSINAYFGLPGEQRDGGWELLCQPLPAWIQVEMSRHRGLGFGLTEGEFAAEYWDLVTERLGPTPWMVRSAAQVLALLDERFAATCGEPIPAADLEHRFVGAPETEERVGVFSRIIGALTGARILRRDGERLQPGGDVLWASRLLGAGWDGDVSSSAGVIAAMAPWRADGDRSVARLRQAVLREWLVRLDSDGAVDWDLGEVLDALWDRKGGNPVLWGAAPRLSVETQRRLVIRAKRSVAAIAGGHDVYLFLRWMLVAPDGVWNPGVAVRIACAVATQVAASGLSQYLVSVVDRYAHELELSDVESVTRLLVQLDGAASATGFAGEFVGVFMRAATWVQGETLAVAALRLLDQGGNRSGSAEPNRAAPGETRTAPRESAFALLVVDAVASSVMSDDVVDGYETLVAARWFGSRGDLRPAQRTTRNAAHRALGHAYGSARHAPQVVEIVDRLVDGTDRTRLESALFVVRHTRTTGGLARVSVDEDFHPALRVISRRRGELPPALVERWVLPLLEANGID